ncbi:MAG: hypothetical protein PWQ77_1930 [Kosmotogales bacterium]|nr:hypothetical protein [Kosmotogales bacterium]
MNATKRVTLKNGEILNIRRVVVEDSSEIIEYINKIAGESENLTFGPGEFKNTPEEEKRFIESINESDNSLMIVGIIKDEITSILNFNSGRRNRIKHVGEFGISVRKDFWNIGVGKEMMNYLIDWAKNTKIIKKINLMVRKDNLSAISLYKKFGFEIEGTNSRYFKIRGKYYDLLYMGLKID